LTATGLAAALAVASWNVLDDVFVDVFDGVFAGVFDGVLGIAET
jgi:hypothetical protein